MYLHLFCLGWYVIPSPPKGSLTHQIMWHWLEGKGLKRGILPEEEAIQGGRREWIHFWYCPQLRPQPPATKPVEICEKMEN